MYPLVRFGTGDLSAFVTEPCSCGLGTPRIAGWLGRVGEAVKVRGMFLHPRQAQAALAAVPEVARFRLVVDRVEHRDVLRCEVVARDGADAARVVSIVKDRIRSALRFDAEVTVVEEIDPAAPPITDVRRWD
jgi:phenylacetate-CoA ligase